MTGPTGSGKSTTLYAALNAISSMENNVCTVEDPIEYHLPLINQFQVQEKIGMTFSKALRTLLRQDPDVIMVGEIRDEETARTAIQAALTGHLVFSTLHTNDACSAITRLINMGVEPYLIGAALNMVLAQRLVRRICPKCRDTYEPPRTIRKALERMGYEFETFYRGVGCRSCRNTGFKGRIGVHELLVVSDELRDAIVAGQSASHIRQLAGRRHDSPAPRRLPQGPRGNHDHRRNLPNRRRCRRMPRAAAGHHQYRSPPARTATSAGNPGEEDRAKPTMNFQYRVRDPLGRTHDGAIEAATREEASQCSAATASRSSHSTPPDRRGPVSPAGQPPRNHLRHQPVGHHGRHGHHPFRRPGGHRRTGRKSHAPESARRPEGPVEAGEDFSTALAGYPKYFDRTYVALVKASEATGSAGRDARPHRHLLGKEVETRGKVRAAMAYPAVMMVVATGVTIFLLTYILPKFAPLFRRKATKLPTPTVVMMALSDALLDYWYFWAVGAVALVVAVVLGIRTQQGKRFWTG